MTQAQQVLSYLRSGNALSQIEATHYFNICCLAERIRDLRKQGHGIISTPVVKNGKRFMKYSLS